MKLWEGSPLCTEFDRISAAFFSSSSAIFQFCSRMNSIAFEYSDKLAATSGPRTDSGDCSLILTNSEKHLLRA